MASPPTNSTNRHDEVIGVDFDISKARANLGILQQAVDALKASVGGGGGIPVALPGMPGVGAGLGGGATQSSTAVVGSQQGSGSGGGGGGSSSGGGGGGSSSGGGGGGSSSGGGGGGGTRSSGSLWSSAEIAAFSRANQDANDTTKRLPGMGLRPTDYSQYMASGFSNDARMLAQGVFTGHAGTAAMAMGGSMLGSSLIGSAKRRADMIDEMRRNGTPESELPGMGMLKYASPVAGIVSAAVGGLTDAAKAGDDLQDKYSRRQASTWRDVAMAQRQGALEGRLLWSRADREDEGTSFNRYAKDTMAMDTEASNQVLKTFNTKGFRDTGMGAVDVIDMMRTGVSAETVTNFRALKRLGLTDQETGEKAQKAWIGSMQASGLEGDGVDRALAQIIEHTKAMAQRGVRVDLDDMRRVVDAGINAGMRPERVAQGLNTMRDNNMSLRDQFVNSFKGYSDALVLQKALRGGGSISDVYERVGDMSESDTLEALSHGTGEAGKLATAARTGLRVREDMRPLRFGMPMSREAHDIIGEAGDTSTAAGMAFSKQRALADRDVKAYASTADADTFTRLQERAGRQERTKMDFSEGLSASLDNFTEVIRTLPDMLHSALWPADGR